MPISGDRLKIMFEAQGRAGQHFGYENDLPGVHGKMLYHMVDRVEH